MARVIRLPMVRAGIGRIAAGLQSLAMGPEETLIVLRVAARMVEDAKFVCQMSPEDQMGILTKYINEEISKLP